MNWFFEKEEQQQLKDYDGQHQKKVSAKIRNNNSSEYVQALKKKISHKGPVHLTYWNDEFKQLKWNINS